MLIVLPVEGNQSVFSELHCCKNQQTTEIWKEQERIKQRQTTPMSMSMFTDYLNKADKKQTNHKKIFNC